MTLDAPRVGQYVRDKGNNGKRYYKVTDIFQGSSGHAAMILEWTERDPSIGNIGRRRRQVFTCRDWRKRWEVLRLEGERD